MTFQPGQRVRAWGLLATVVGERTYFGGWLVRLDGAISSLACEAEDMEPTNEED